MSDNSFEVLVQDFNAVLNLDKFSYPENYKFGGKVAGLVFAKNIIKKFPQENFPSLKLNIPKYWLLEKKYFDLFISQNNLSFLAEHTDNELKVIQAFERANLPAELKSDIYKIAESSTTPLAVRASNLLECDDDPAVGLYGTKILPNSFEDVNLRYQNILDAIKFVYSTAFFKKAKDHFKNSNHNREDDSVAIMIIEMAGKKYGDYFYPNISGVLKTHDFYTSGNRKPTDRVVNICLGLGKTIDDKNYSWRYSPSFPKKAPPFNSTREMLHKTQTKFWAINVGNKSVNSIYENEYLTSLDLNRAEEDGTLKFVASTYNAEYDKVMMGMRVDGPRIINFSTLLKLNENKLNDFLVQIAETSEEVFGCSVRIEFAITFKDVWEFSIVQIRPLNVTEENINLNNLPIECDEILLRGDKVLGNGTENNIGDIVFVDPFKLSLQNTSKIAAEIEKFNQYLLNQNKNYLFIGFGRIGSSDSFLGIPIDYKSISGARVIVEATHKLINAQPSKGAHFYQNLSIHKVKFFSIEDDLSNNIDWEWIQNQTIVNQTEFVKHISFNKPLKVLVDGKTGTGVIIK